MNFDASTRELLVVSIGLLFFIGCLSVVWGKRFFDYFHWAIGVAVLGLFVELAVIWSHFLDGGVGDSWIVGWALPRGESGALLVGIGIDRLAVVMVGMVTFVSALLLLSFQIWAKEKSRERILSAVALSSSGVALSWFSASPWLSFVGIVAVVFGGLISLGTRWLDEREAELCLRFLWERSWGILLAILGTAILAGGRTGLLWLPHEGWSGFSSSVDFFGASILVLGLFSLLQAFPFSSWNIMPSDAPPLLRTAFNQVLIAWAVFAPLVRGEALFRQVGLMPYLGWAGLLSAIFSLFTSLFQPQGRLGLNLWLSGGFALAFSGLAFSGPLAALGILVCVGISGMVFSNAISAMDIEKEPDELSQKKTGWIKIACLVSILIGTGTVEGLFGGGWARFLSDIWENPAGLAGVIAIFILFSIQGWRLGWIALRVRFSSGASWYSVLYSFAYLLVLPFWYWLIERPETKTGALGVILGVNAITVLVSYWTSGRAADLWKGLAGAMPGVSKMMADNFWVDKAGAAIFSGVRTISTLFLGFVDDLIWTRRLPELSTRAMVKVGKGIAIFDRHVVDVLNSSVKKSVSVPGKLLQLLQCGDVQWYLVFGVGAGIAMLLHFLRY